ncbi:G2/mitotic-specific cyclin-B2-like isoform X2 [Amblyomma americanum]
MGRFQLPSRSTKDGGETASRTLEEFLRVLSERPSATNSVHQPESSSTSRAPDSDADDMLLLETQWALQPVFLSAQKVVDSSVRERNVHWLIGTRNVLQFSPVTLFLAVSLADRYLEACVVDKRQMELLWAAALCVAVKHKEPEYHVFYRSYLASTKGIGESMKTELCDMEEVVSRAVDWSLGLPSPLDFLRRNCRAAKASRQERLTAMYILEVCLVDYTMAWIKPSKKAASALYCAMHYQGRQNPCWGHKMQLCSGHDIGSLMPIVARMQEFLIAACQSDMWAPYESYEKMWSGTLG